MSPEASRSSETGVGRRAVRRPVSELSSKVKCVLNFCARRCMPILSGRQAISIVLTPWFVCRGALDALEQLLADAAPPVRTPSIVTSASDQLQGLWPSRRRSNSSGVLRLI
jgi:hypothetical protein